MAIVPLFACSPQPGRETSAIVVDIAPHTSARWHTDEVVVTARSADGRLGMKSVATSLLACRLGDQVKASERGIVLDLDDHACLH